MSTGGWRNGQAVQRRRERRRDRIGPRLGPVHAGKFSIAGEGLNIGREGAEPVTDDFPGEYPWPFVGGTIVQAAVDVSSEPFVDLAQEARMAFALD